MKFFFEKILVLVLFFVLSGLFSIPDLIKGKNVTQISKAEQDSDKDDVASEPTCVRCS